jgi:DNA-3-methyladenine glycosylase II
LTAVDHAAASRHLARVDPVMKRLMKEIGPCELSRARMAPYDSLVRAVAHQQLHGVAAERILARFTALTPGARYPTPQEVLVLPEESLRAVGFSGAKARALHDIADKTVAGVIPSRRALARLGDEEIIERLTTVRGVGRWTVEILLIRLGRVDVLPADDFGLRAGFRAAYGGKEMPTTKELRAFGERWRPFRTVASWYLWRAADRFKRLAATEKRPDPPSRRGESGRPRTRASRAGSPAPRAPSRSRPARSPRGARGRRRGSRAAPIPRPPA